MKSAKCLQCGFVGWSDVEFCKACGAPTGLSAQNYAPASAAYNSWQPAEDEKKGMAIFSLVLGILSFFTLGLFGVGAIAGIILAVVAMRRVRDEPWKYGGRTVAIAGLVLSITSLATMVPIGIVAAIAIPNLLASRMAANEGAAIRSLNTIASAEMVYQATAGQGRYGTLQELESAGLIDSALGSGVKSGYRFTIELTESGEITPAGFAVVGVPVDYRSSGMRSFYIDETAVIRGGDNHGGPSSRDDDALQSSPLRRDIRYGT
jgi:type II secretory pathway pseudopilin PulG